MSEVICRRDLTGGVATEGLGDLGRIDSAAIVGDADQIPAAVPDFHRDGSGTGIDGILRKLLHDVDGALHDFTGGNAVDGVGA